MSECIVCQRTDGKLFFCSGCMKVHYCSNEHQLSHWKDHKKQCKKWQKEAKKAAKKKAKKEKKASASASSSSSSSASKSATASKSLLPIPDSGASFSPLVKGVYFDESRGRGLQAVADIPRGSLIMRCNAFAAVDDINADPNSNANCLLVKAVIEQINRLHTKSSSIPASQQLLHSVSHLFPYINQIDKLPAKLKKFVDNLHTDQVFPTIECPPPASPNTTANDCKSSPTSSSVSSLLTPLASLILDSAAASTSNTDTEAVNRLSLERIMYVVALNCFSTTNGQGAALFLTPSLLNHSCYPNASRRVSDEGVLTLTTLRDIKAGEEVTISYVPLMTEKKDRRERLHATHGFLCECIRCHNTILCPKAMCRAPMSMNDGESKYVCTARTPGASSAGDDSMGQDGGSKGDGVCQGWRSVHEVEETLYRLTRRYQAVQDHIVQAYGLHMTSTASLLDHSSNKHDDSTRDRKRTYMVGEGTNPFFKDLTEDEKKKRKYFVEKANKEIENSHAEAAELLGVRDTLEANNDPASGENTPCTYTHPFYFSLVLLIETKIGRRYARPLKLRSNGKMSQDLLFPSLSTQHQTAEATGDDDADADFFSSDAFNGDGDDDDESSDSDGEE